MQSDNRIEVLVTPSGGKELYYTLWRRLLDAGRWSGSLGKYQSWKRCLLPYAKVPYVTQGSDQLLVFATGSSLNMICILSKLHHTLIVKAYIAAYSTDRFYRDNCLWNYTRLHGCESHAEYSQAWLIFTGPRQRKNYISAKIPAIPPGINATPFGKSTVSLYLACAVVQQVCTWWWSCPPLLSQLSGSL